MFTMTSEFKYFFTSESVSKGHPDKLCDQISDLILDEYLRVDSNSKVAAECMAVPNRLIIAGEYKCASSITKDYLHNKIVDFVKSIGYDQESLNCEKLIIEDYMHSQSQEINNAVEGESEGAGDQGIMFGYATDETPVFMPAPIYYANEIMKRVAENKKYGPDAKTQVTLKYDANDRPIGVDTVILSVQHKKDVAHKNIENDLIPVINSVFQKDWMSRETKYMINPSGSFVIGGPQSDVGLTGRKIIVDTYGGAVAHGGGAFSGKDPSKVDRSGAYMARYLAKNIVASGVAKKCLIQLSYAIGVSKPVSVFVDTMGTSSIPSEKIAAFISKNIDLTPKGIKNGLNLCKPIYLPTASYGHFGRESVNVDEFTWERCDLSKMFSDKLL